MLVKDPDSAGLGAGPAGQKQVFEGHSRAEELQGRTPESSVSGFHPSIKEGENHHEKRGMIFTLLYSLQNVAA